MPTLHVLQGPDKGRVYHTQNEPAIMGRGSDQIQLTDHGASRRHAEIRPDNGSWLLTDLGSSNGTYLNGQRVVNSAPLKHGDQIKVGSTLMVFSGQESMEGLTGAQRIRDEVEMDYHPAGGSSILSACNALEESVILQPPETADAVAAWNIVYKIAELIGSIDSVDGFLERVADLIFDHMIIDHLVLLVRNESTGEMSPQVVRYRTPSRGRRPKFVTSQTIIKHVMDHRDGVLCANTMTDDRFSGDSMPDSVHRLGLRSIICVPIVMHDEIFGVFHFDCTMSRHTYTEEQLRLAVSIGRLTGMAIENIRFQESRVRTERLAAAGETVAYLSHYIRNILQGMQGGVDIVDMSIKKRSLEAAESGWALMRRNLDRIFVLTMNMLTFSKERQPRIEPGELNRIIEDVIALSQGRADEKSVMLLTDLEEMPPVPLDPDGIHQVVNNMVLNAIDAAPRDTGRINISTQHRPDRGEVCITINDNGCGIAPEDRDRIFDAFHSSKGHGGTGLGLAAASKIVTELGGRIEVESTVGEGTTFHITLPLEPEGAATADGKDSPDESAESARHPGT